MKISVLVPCYNAEHYVGAALDSILAQDWPDFEIIVVNDGSTDASRDLIRRYEPRIRVIEQENRGAAAARNAAFAASSGSHIVYVDADDVIATNHLSALAACQSGRTVAIGRWGRFFTDPSEASFPERSTAPDLSGPEWLVAEWTTGLPMMQSGMFLVPRELIKDHGGWDERLTLIDDFEFFARIIARSDGVRLAAEARLFYRSAVAGSLSGTKGRAAVESEFLSIMLGTSHLLAVEDSPRTRLACANILKSFDYEHFPRHFDLRSNVRARAAELGGADLEPVGPPRFHALRQFIGWRAARLVQRAMGR